MTFFRVSESRLSQIDKTQPWKTLRLHSLVVSIKLKRNLQYDAAITVFTTYLPNQVENYVHIENCTHAYNRFDLEVFKTESKMSFNGWKNK